MSEQTTYIANTITLQTADSFDLGAVRAITYTTQVFSDSNFSLLEFKVVHDGVEISKTQQGTGVTNAASISFSANINSYVGEIKFTPTEIPTTVIFDKIIYSANLYAEHTRAGRYIKGTEGVAYSSNVFVIRQANNNFYGNVATYANTSTFTFISQNDGPSVSNNPEFIDSSGWIPENDIIFTVASGKATLKPNNPYKESYIYQQLTVEPGNVYKAQFRYYTTPNLNRFIIGRSLSENNYVDRTMINTFANLQFTPIENKVFLSIGRTYGEEALVSNTYVYKYLPFNTYNQYKGTFYYKWQDVANGTSLLTITNFNGKTRILRISNTAQVIITEDTSDFVVGNQITGNNKLSFSYSNTAFIASLNGNAVTSQINTIVDKMLTMVFNVEPRIFSYSPEIISNTVLVEMTVV